VPACGRILRRFPSGKEPAMLVLSRRLNERILFPGMNISVQVVAFKPGQVRLGIEAPPEVTVLREEVPDRVAEWGAPASPLRGATTLLRLRKANQLLRNRLRAGSADLKLLRRQLDLGMTDEARVTLDKMEEDFELQPMTQEN
jgi:carbon storage regulator CsrA